ncbi:hypothetical protein C8R44DRAFT_233208 [Mycena epipterygia]|nr:hypothetical protein C8R44DRAFT_233208 [Mycena epipterygia]
MTMPGKRSHRFNLSAPRDTPISFHLFAPPTPASAVADRIFNDPESWNAGLTKDWDMIDQFPSVPSGPDSADFTTLKPFTSKFKLPVRPDLVSPESELESDIESYNWEGVKDKGEGDDVPFITLNLDSRPGKDKVTQLDRMSILWTHGNLFRAFPSPLASASVSAPTSPTTDAPSLGLFQPPHPLSPTLTPCSARLSHFSPLRSASKSATWSVLEYYGVTLPDTPRTPRDLPAVRSSESASASFLCVPSHPAAPPPPVPSLSATVATPPPPAPVPKAAPPASRAPTPTPTSTTHQGGCAPSARARSGSVRPLPSIPFQVQLPPVPPLDLPASRTRRARAHTTGIRSLPMPPTPPPKDTLPAPHSRPQTFPKPAAVPNMRHQAALSLG